MFDFTYLSLLDLKTAFEWAGTVCGITGAAMVSSNTKYSKFGWIPFLISSVMLMGFAVKSDAWGLFLLECCFFLTNLIGLYRWLLKPYFESKAEGLNNELEHNA